MSAATSSQRRPSLLDWFSDRKLTLFSMNSLSLLLACATVTRLVLHNCGYSGCYKGQGRAESGTYRLDTLCLLKLSGCCL